LAAVAAVAEICHSHAISCHLEPAANYIVARGDEERGQLDAEMDAARRAGLEPRQVEDLSEVPFPATAALALDGQAQLHPRRYLLGLATALTAAGGEIFERSRVTEITGNGPFTLRTDEGTVRAQAVLVATHYPIVEQGFFVTRIHPRRSYVVAAPLRATIPAGMFITADAPTRSVRTAPLENGRRLLLVGGEGHAVGRDDQPRERYETLERFMCDHFDVEETQYRWSTQDNFSVDGLPYIGRMGEEGDLYVATGFAGWGMSNGTLAGIILSDLVQRKQNAWAQLYDPERRTVTAGAKTFVSENLALAPHQVDGSLVAGSLASTADIAAGDGAIVSSDGAEYAVSRAADGRLTVVSATCTHMGCTVAWNNAESSWDCPCHGSRFASDGRVLHGPALHPLKQDTLPAATAQTS
jgi:glycine/D-amino acid oxidase-like deaminating enzyme/nitrite reductase/ring-hydroxylating ferredoxin subunit